MDTRPEHAEPHPTVENLRDAAWQTERELGYPLDIMAELYYEFTSATTLTQHHDE